VKREFCLHC